MTRLFLGSGTGFFQAGKVFIRMMRGACQRRGRDHQKPFRPRRNRIGLKLIRCDKPVNRRMFARRLQILANSDEINIGTPHVIHHLHNFFARFSSCFVGGAGAPTANGTTAARVSHADSAVP